MSQIPSPIRGWVREFITGEGSDEVSSQAPVQSVNSQTGNVTVTAPVDSVNGKTGTVSLSASDVGALGASSDVDHQQTTNRTHDGDDISPNTVTTNALEADERSITNVGAEVKLSTTQTIPSGTFTKVEFDNVLDDDTSSWSTSNYEFTVPRDGDYLVDATVNFDGLSDGSDYNIGISVNGIRKYSGEKNAAASADESAAISHTIKALSQGDALSIKVFQNSGSVDLATARETFASFVQIA